MRWLIALILYSLAPLQAAWGEEIDLRIRAHSIRASVVNTQHSRERGLMHRTRLCENCGMLFVFPSADKHAFWMKDTPLPLSIAFIAADGSILNIAEMQANSTHVHFAQDNALYALEMNEGWFAGHAIEAKDRVEGLQLAPPGQ